MLPQIIFISLAILELGLFMAKHGDRRENYNFFVKIFDALIMFALLYWGGFFDVFFK